MKTSLKNSFPVSNFKSCMCVRPRIYAHTHGGGADIKKKIDTHIFPALIVRFLGLFFFCEWQSNLDICKIFKNSRDWSVPLKKNLSFSHTKVCKPDEADGWLFCCIYCSLFIYLVQLILAILAPFSFFSWKRNLLGLSLAGSLNWMTGDLLA